MLSIRGVGLVYVVYVQRSVHGTMFDIRGVRSIYVVYIRCLWYTFTRAVLRLVWPSILLQSSRDRVATAAETVTA